MLDKKEINRERPFPGMIPFSLESSRLVDVAQSSLFFEDERGKKLPTERETLKGAKSSLDEGGSKTNN